METPAATLAEVLDRVLRPLSLGAPLQIGRPIGPTRARAAAEAVPSREDEPHERELASSLVSSSLDAAEHAVLARIRRISPMDLATVGPLLTREVVWLAALAHDAVASMHPDLEGWFSARARARLLALTAKALDEVPPPLTVRGALLRHGWLGALPRWRCSRREVRWWTGHATFVGKPPPPRLLAWPEARRVRVETTTVPIAELAKLYPDRPEISALAPYFESVIARLYARSPISDLADAARAGPPFGWSEAATSLVSSAAGARLARRAIALGPDAGRAALEVIAAVGGPRAAALTDTA